ncbi:hypothetical protein [Trinickia dinghuensis]|uniref:hypothetical protein n=1 Tax=Trinickia dinghuensis TaxID=2291023 RepID=UPI0011C0576A|nr:hypothetical protein [Trinickia dinghuensis]
MPDPTNCIAPRKPARALNVRKIPTDFSAIFPASLAGALPISTLFTIRHNLPETRNGQDRASVKRAAGQTFPKPLSFGIGIGANARKRAPVDTFD